MTPRKTKIPEPMESESVASDEPTRHLGITPDEIGTLPILPGVYIMRDAAGQVLYIGKALNLHSRVHSYFTREGDARFNVRYLMRRVARVETIVTANELEALLLENTLIKKHQPRYNIRLRDDKTYVSVRIDLGHPWPRAVVMRRRGDRAEKNVSYLGPYASAGSVRDMLRQLQRIFPIRSCPDHVLRNRSRPCLLYQVHRCCAPCVKPVDSIEYRELVESTILALKGRTRELLRQLRDRMARHAKAMEYERAAVVRDRIGAIDRTTERQGVHRHEAADRDVVVLEQAGGFGAFVVFGHRNGILVSSRSFLVRDHDRAGPDLIDEFLARYYENEAPPREVLVDPAPAGIPVLEEWLGERREGRVHILTPQRGEKRQLVATARENARRLLEQHHAGEQSIEEAHREIVERFHLMTPPDPIECYDISTIQGFATVGAMVTFREGQPDKNNYRRFRIKSIAGQDDFGALREVLERRLRRITEGEESGPGLIVIDGGKGHLAMAVDVMVEMGVTGIPVVGMAKSRVKHRGDKTWRTEERFFLPGRKNPVVFRANSPALYLLIRLRDEAHRFGITYHRELRKKINLRSVLESVPGVGKTRLRALLRHFGSLKKVREATADQLAETPGIPSDVAQRIHQYLRESPEETPQPENR